MSLPEQCKGCELTGMDAIRCKIFDSVDLGLLEKAGKNCASEENSASTNNIGGSPFVGSVGEFNRIPKKGSGYTLQRKRVRIGRGWKRQRLSGKE